jgi:hypothetical protein
MNSWKKGSFTVEAAFLVPLSVMITVLLIFCIFYVHNQVWYTAAALESALAGNSRLEGSGAGTEETAEKHMKKRMEQQAMPGMPPSVTVSDTGAGLRISCEGQMFTLLPDGLFVCRTEGEAERVRPAAFLKKLWMAEKLIGAAEEVFS